MSSLWSDGGVGDPMLVAGGWLLLILAWPFLHNQNKIKGRTTATDSFVNFAGASQTVGVHLNCYPRSCTTMQSRQDTMCGCKFYWCHGSVSLCISLWFILLFISDFLSLWKKYYYRHMTWINFSLKFCYRLNSVATVYRFWCYLIKVYLVHVYHLLRPIL